MPGPVSFGRQPSDLAMQNITAEEEAAQACLPRAPLTSPPESRGSVAVDALVMRFKTREMPEKTSSATLDAAKHCVPELIAATLTCAATGFAAAPTLGATLLAASACIGAGAAAGRCLANETAASERRAMAATGAKTCEREGGLPVSVHADTIVCLIP